VYFCFQFNSIYDVPGSLQSNILLKLCLSNIQAVGGGGYGGGGGGGGFYCVSKDKTNLDRSAYRFATGWTVRGLNPGGGRGFPHSSRLALGPTQRPIKWVPGVKRPGRVVYHLLPSSAEVKARVELYLCSFFGTSWPVLGRTLPLPLSICAQKYQPVVWSAVLNLLFVVQ
jgi:hypothetical protein